jgi:hypothetical protein
MARKTITPINLLSPIKGRRSDARAAQERLKTTLTGYVDDFKDLDTGNLAAGYKDFTTGLTNKFANIKTDTTSTDKFFDESRRSLGTTLDIMRQMGNFQSAQGVLNKQTEIQSGIAGELSKQVKQNELLSLQGADALQNQQLKGKMHQQDAIMRGADASRSLQYQKTQGLMAFAGGQLEGERQIEQSYRNIFGKTFGSDRKLKQNISLVGKSPKGINIYTFKYIDKSFGEGTYQGVMSDEVPNSAVVKHVGGYDMVDYNQLDVEFIKI